MKKSKLKKEIIEQLYWDKGLTTREIAKKIGIKYHSTILRFMKKSNIPIRDKNYADKTYKLNMATKKSKSLIKKNDFIFLNDSKFWHWFGGLFDGEGSFTISIRINKDSNNKYYQYVTPKLQIEMVDINKVITKIHSKIGGSLATYERDKTRFPRRQNVTQIQIFGLKRCIAFAKQLNPFLFVKKETCKKYLDICKLIQQQEHLNKNGFLKICKLRDNLNSRSKPINYRDYQWFKKYVEKIDKGRLIKQNEN